jgi:protein-S-isoprenylcysteine O-methyltransferase Ste14
VSPSRATRSTEAAGGKHLSPIEAMRDAWLATVIIGPLFFVDTPFLTWRQKFVEQRSRQRLVIVTLELDLVALWAIAKFYLKRDARLAPPSIEAIVVAIGLSIAIAGVALSVWGKLRLGKWFSATFAIKQGHELVTDGPYAITRHPIYTGILLALLGSALVWNSLLTLALAALFAVPLFLHTVYEEHLFERHFGDAYSDYQRRVPRLVPRPRP